MSTLTWITGKELEREKNNNGEQLCWKKNMKMKMRNASDYHGENERQ